MQAINLGIESGLRVVSFAFVPADEMALLQKPRIFPNGDVLQTFIEFGVNVKKPILSRQPVLFHALARSRQSAHLR